MTWPLSQDYNEAIQSPRTSFSDAELRAGDPVVNAMGIPIPRSGNFADVYEFRSSAGGHWAVKCFTREVPGLRERYAAISRHLQDAKLPFTVDFTFLEQGIRVLGQWYPVLKMQWVEGLTLNEFVRQYADKPAMLQNLLQIWLRMAARLRESGIAHADLQHGNVLLVPGSTANSLAVKLVDYDGMFVPALAGGDSGEVGHPCYQHPQRLAERTYSLEVDRFPLLLVAAALDGLRVGGKAMWDKYDSGDNLLFREADLRTPVKSPLFYEMLKLTDERASRLARQTLDALKGRLESVPLLEEVLPELHAPAAPKPTTTAMPKRATIQATAAQPTVEMTAIGPDLDFKGEDKPRLRRRRKRGPMRWVGCAAAVGVAVLALAGGIFAWAPWNEPEKPKDKGQIAQNKPDKQPQRPGKPRKTPDSKEAEPKGDGQRKDHAVDPSPAPPKAPEPGGVSALPKPVENTPAPVVSKPVENTPAPVVSKPPEKPPENPAVKDDFVPLFNNKDTTDWKVEGKGAWKVDTQGALVGEGPDAALLTKRRDFKDFTIRAELSASAEAEAYILVRARHKLDGPWQGMSTRIFGDGGTVRAGQADAAFIKNERGVKRLEFKPDESFKLEVRVVRDVIQIHTNGQLTAGCPCRPDPVGGIGLFVLKGALRVTKLEIKKLYRIEGALEGEELKVLGKSGDFVVAPQDMARFTKGKWSGNAQLWCRQPGKGAWVDLELPVAADGKYQVVTYMAKGRDYGIVQFSLDGKPLGQPIDGFHSPEVVSTGAIDLGTVELKKGKATLRVEAADSNEKSVGLRYQWGLDCVVLKRVASSSSQDSDLSPQAKAAKAYEKACKDARAKLLKGFDAALDKLAKIKGSTEQRIKLRDAVKEEKTRFENGGLIPWSGPMRPYVDPYLNVLGAAQGKLGRVYEKLIDAQLRAKNESKVADLRAELKNRLDIQVMARWQYFLNGRPIGLRALYSNGKIYNIDAKATWTYDKGVLTFRFPDQRAPGGVWIDTLHVSADGTTFQGTNNARPPGPKLTGVYVKDN